MSKEPEYILCSKVSESKGVTGSTVTHCVKCDTALWFAPSSHTLMLEHNAKPICFDCAKAMDPVIEAHPPSPEQIKEMMNELMKRKEKQE